MFSVKSRTVPKATAVIIPAIPAMLPNFATDKGFVPGCLSAINAVKANAVGARSESKARFVVAVSVMEFRIPEK